MPAVARVTVAMNESTAVPPAVRLTELLIVNGRLELPGVETNAKLTVAVTLRVAAKLLILAKLSSAEAVVNGPIRKTVIVSGTAFKEKSGTPTVTITTTEWDRLPLMPVTVTA